MTDTRIECKKLLDELYANKISLAEFEVKIKKITAEIAGIPNEVKSAADLFGGEVKPASERGCPVDAESDEWNH